MKVGSQQNLSCTTWLHGRSMADGDITACVRFKIEAAILTIEAAILTIEAAILTIEAAILTIEAAILTDSCHVTGHH